MVNHGGMVNLVGGLEPWNFMAFHILGRIIPTDEVIFFRGVGIPPTSTKLKEKVILGFGVEHGF